MAEVAACQGVLAPRQAAEEVAAAHSALPADTGRESGHHWRVPAVSPFCMSRGPALGAERAHLRQQRCARADEGCYCTARA